MIECCNQLCMMGLIAFLKATHLTKEQKKYLSDIQLSANQLLDAQVTIDTLLLASLNKENLFKHKQGM